MPYFLGMRVHWIIIFLVGVMILGTLVFSETYASHSNIKIHTQIDLNVKSGSSLTQIQVYPALSTKSGQTLESNDIIIRVDGVYKKTVKANEWSVNIPINFGFQTIKATFESMEFGLNTYLRSYDSVGYTLGTKSGTTQTTENQKIPTTLSLSIRGGTQDGTIQVFPILKTDSGDTVMNTNVKINKNNKTVKIVSVNRWSDDIYLGIGSHGFTALYIAPPTSRYASTFETINTVVTSKPSTFTTSSLIQTSDNDLAKIALVTKSSHEEMIKVLSLGIKTAEDSLSGLSFENLHSKRAIDDAWTIRSEARSSLEAINAFYRNADLYLKNNDYQDALYVMSGIDREADFIIADLEQINRKIKSAKKFKDGFEGEDKFCFLFWCWGGSSQNSGLDVRIKNLESQIKIITNEKAKLRSASQELTIGQQQQEISKVDTDIITITAADIERLQQAEFKKLEETKRLQQAKLEKERQRLEESARQQQIQAGYEQQRLEDEIRQQQIQIENERQRMEEEMRQQQIQMEQERKRLEEQIRQQQFQAEYERQRLAEQIRQQQIQAEQERQRVAAEKQLEDNKDYIRLQAKSYPLIKGWMNGGLSFYVQQLHTYASQDVRDRVEDLASWMDGRSVNGVKLKRVYSSVYADFTINWVKDYQEKYIGRQVGSHLIVGLGSSNCFGEWKPFDGFSVYKIMWHEIGHVMGQDHVSDKNNIMYEKGTGTKYQYDFSKTIMLPDGDVWLMFFCNSGSVSFTTKGDSTTSGYKVYVVPSGTNAWDAIKGKAAFYTSCSAYKDKMTSFSNSCNVERGSILVLYNPTFLEYTGITLGKDLQIQVKMINTNPALDKDMSFDSGSRYFSQAYLDQIKEMFR